MSRIEGVPEASQEGSRAGVAGAQRERQTVPTLPDKPLVVIESSRGWVPLDLGDLWLHRDLLFLLTWRDVKVRYKQTVFGVAWVVLQPLLATLVFTVFLGKLVGVPTDGIPYPLFAYAGLVPWMFLSGGVTSAGQSLVGSANLITKVYFPRMIIPAASLTARLVDFAVAGGVLLGMIGYYGVKITPAILALPAVVALVVLLALGIGLWASALNVKYRDVGAVLPTLMQLWMYLSPVVYPVSLVPPAWRFLYTLNPVTGVIVNFRALLLGLELDGRSLAVSTVVTLSRIAEPTAGRAELFGHVGSLLEVGSGFHPELRGRENIYLMNLI